jgi:seryl-tRNA synthetase
MLDIKFIREHVELVKQKMQERRADMDVDRILDMDAKRRDTLQQVETLKHERNTVSDAIAGLKKAKQDASAEIERMRLVSQQIKQLDDQVKEYEEQLRTLLLTIPNIQDDSVPVGMSEADNPEVKRWGEPPKFDFEPKPHWELGEALGILDLECASKLSGARFALFKGTGALMVRALLNFMLDLHTREHGYKECFPPLMVNAKTMTGTGQLPKFEADLFKVEGGYYLIPTAEVPLTNMPAEEILDGAQLPLYYTAYTPCFRSEAGSYGKDTRGLIRQHQFDKVELVKFVKPETSFAELEKLLLNAEEVLKRLELPYRVITLCTADLGFASAKTYDLEVWIPTQGKYREISSCSNCTDFQARRANIRYKPEPKAKPEFVHTLNGSGLAIGRTWIAIVENCQQADGSVVIPKALRSYMGGLERIEKS